MQLLEYNINMMTILLVFINVIVFFLINMGKLDSDDLSMSYHTVFNKKEYYRIITSAFTHVDIMHIFFNMSSLINVGTFVEQLFGPWKMLVIYFGSMILGKILSLQIRHNRHDDYTMSLGASGAICGILGTYFMVVLYYFGREGITELLRPLASLVIMSILPGVDGTSHFSCMAVGMAITFLMMFV